MNVYQFRDCLLNTLERSVIRDNNHVELTTKTFDVLQYLIENAGKVVTKDQILGKVWNGSFVEESNLPVHISKLRRSLNESKDRRFIETVQGTGYRFVAPLQTVGLGDWETAVSLGDGKGVDPTAPLMSIAVLPLENESGDPAIEYLVDGLTESLINSLSQIPNLTVIARNTVFRYKDVSVNALEIANTLGVSNVLTGRLRLAGDNLLFSLELTRNGLQMWGSQYDVSFSEIVNIKQSIVNSVSTILTSRLSGSGALPAEGNADSFRFLLMGKCFFRKRTAETVLKAIEYFEKSISCCSTNVLSYAAIVEAFRFLYILDRYSRSDTIQKIEPILKILQTLEQSLDVVHVMRANLMLHLDWKVESAAKCFETALELNPNMVDAHAAYGDLMALLGRHDEVEYHAQRILCLDPISPLTSKRVGRLFYRTGDYEKALCYFNDAAELEPSDYEALLLVGATHTELEDYDRALEFLERSYDCYQNIETLSMIGFVHGLAGNVVAAKKIIERISLELRDHHSHSINLARILLTLGEKEKMYALLEDAYNQHAVEMFALAFDSRWKSVCDENRFRSLVKRVKESSETMKTACLYF